jgi:hypothetical protein
MDENDEKVYIYIYIYTVYKTFLVLTLALSHYLMGRETDKTAKGVLFYLLQIYKKVCYMLRL